MIKFKHALAGKEGNEQSKFKLIVTWKDSKQEQLYALSSQICKMRQKVCSKTIVLTIKLGKHTQQVSPWTWERSTRFYSHTTRFTVPSFLPVFSKNFQSSIWNTTFAVCNCCLQFATVNSTSAMHICYRFRLLG